MWTSPAAAQTDDAERARDARTPTATLTAAPVLSFRADTDSNSPAVWELIRGVPTFLVFNSTAGAPRRSSGRSLTTLRPPQSVSIVDATPGGVWMEAVVSDGTGTLYGYYHNEIAGTVCPESGKVLPRIGAARSADFGGTWQDLGIILEAPAGTERCDTPNTYFVGGVGDFSVLLDPDRQDLYIFFSQYEATEDVQGVAVARLAWVDRDDPQGKICVWNDGAWLPASLMEVIDEVSGDVLASRWEYPMGTPMYRATRSWHADDGLVDAFWGPSVHWNTGLQQYVMLLNHAKDAAWTQEGVYIAFGTTLSDPAGWTRPRRLLEGGGWYPQVVGLESATGTDKEAGATSRFFMSGTSEHLLTLTW